MLARHGFAHKPAARSSALLLCGASHSSLAARPFLCQGVSTLSHFVWQEPLGQVTVFVDKCMRPCLF